MSEHRRALVDAKSLDAILDREPNRYAAEAPGIAALIDAVTKEAPLNAEREEVAVGAFRAAVRTATAADDAQSG
ncbi:hypothetical protein [Micromonospora endolithica]|uniref:Uncharacterized protein n=1 Tax=Micromonospora endolithica TaxID=230091 RepID=A0A3A9YQJ8_9ACTN|nr:hypothetical protein [Micromonospora endolithica]RKN38253.1 hypothetical protein D7223_31425 [Micromonospora endolithica]